MLYFLFYYISHADFSNSIVESIVVLEKFKQI